MKKIALRGIDGKGKVAIVDDSLYDYLMQWKWYVNINGYAVNGKNQLMHRVVIQAKPGTITDHISRKKLDNRRVNLRSVTQSENAQNNKSRYGNSRLPKLQDLRPLINTMT